MIFCKLWNIIPVTESVPRVPAYASGPSGTGFNLHFQGKSLKDESLNETVLQAYFLSHRRSNNKLVSVGVQSPTEIKASVGFMRCAS